MGRPAATGVPGEDGPAAAKQPRDAERDLFLDQGERSRTFPGAASNFTQCVFCRVPATLSLVQNDAYKSASAWAFGTFTEGHVGVFLAVGSCSWPSNGRRTRPRPKAPTSPSARSQYDASTSLLSLNRALRCRFAESRTWPRRCQAELYQLEDRFHQREELPV